MYIRPLPPIAFLRQCFRYDYASGKLYWKVRPAHHFAGWRGRAIFNGRFAGKEAGTIHETNGAVHLIVGVSYLGRKLGDYFVHRIIWAWVRGEDPGESILDHRDNNGLNNRFDNLRKATQLGNTHNSRIASHNTSGFKGVYYRKPRSKWYGALLLNGKRHLTPHFDTAEQAAAALRRLRSKLHKEFANHG